jgi:Leucine-rich repeat (LRR) protein
MGWVGEIPVSFGNLVNLQKCYMNENKLTGNVIVCWHKYPRLTRMDWVGEIPESFGNLVNLQYCYMNGNNLTGNVIWT